MRIWNAIEKEGVRVVEKPTIFSQQKKTKKSFLLVIFCFFDMKKYIVFDYFLILFRHRESNGRAHAKVVRIDRSPSVVEVATKIDTICIGRAVATRRTSPI